MLDPNKAVEQMQSEFSAGYEAGAASRDAEVQRLQMALADAEALELGTAEKCDQLRTELAAALAACKSKDEAIREGLETYKIPMTARIVEALAIQPDGSALEAMIAKAGEVMREKCIMGFLIRTHWYAEKGMRALPAVTLEDLK
jgi:hypothetical protein